MGPKILVLCFTGPDEVILATPVIRVLRAQLDARIHFCTFEENIYLLDASPYVSELWSNRNSFPRMVRAFSREKFDHIINLDNSFKSKIIVSLLRRPGSSNRRLSFRKWLMVRFKINKLPNEHTTYRMMDALQPLNIRMDTLGLDYFIPEKEEMNIGDLPDEFRKNYVIFALSAPYPTRQLPLKRMVELCDRINKPVILIGEERDADKAESLVSFFGRKEGMISFEEGLVELNKKTTILNMCGKLSMHQSASLIRQAAYVFCHDSIYMHISAAFKKETFGIWGNTIPLFGNYPFRTRFTVFENNRIHCRPCSTKGFRNCPKGHLKCLNDIVFDFYLP